MAKKNKPVKEVDESEQEIINDFENNEIEDIETQEEYIESYQEESCPILWIKPTAFGFSFQGYGISEHTSNGHILDSEKINKDFITIKYKGQIGTPSFEYHIIYN